MVRKEIFASAALAVSVLAVAASSAYGDHSWGNYHWERTTTIKTIALGDNTSGKWKPENADSYLQTTSKDWSKTQAETGYTQVIQTKIGRGGTRPKTCKPTSGRVEVCNARYGRNGWLGLAQIWISGGHITQGVAKLNDTYFDTSTYNKPAWRNLVMCQEVAHTFGLDHQDEDFYNTNLETCMDYTNSPLENQHPNAHDYEQLSKIYLHADSTLQTVSSSPGKGNGFQFATYVPDDDFETDWGRPVAFTSKGQPRLFVKDLGAGNRRLTHVFWTEDARPRQHYDHD